MIGNNDILRCAVVWDQGPAEVINVHHLRATNIVAQTQAQIRADVGEFFEDAYSAVVGQMWGSLNHDRIEVFNISDGNPEPAIGRIALLDGTNAGELLPAQVAAMVYFRTGVSRRIGRTFIPAFTEASIANADWNAGAIAALESFGNYFLLTHTMTNGVTLEKVIYDKLGAVARSIIDRVVPFDSRTQRRRRAGVGS